MFGSVPDARLKPVWSFAEASDEVPIRPGPVGSGLAVFGIIRTSMASRCDVVVVSVALLLSACSSSRSAAPSTTGAGGGSRLEVRVTRDGCTPRHLRTGVGLTQLALANHSSARASFEVLSGDHVVGRVEALAAGESSVISLELTRGVYRTACQIGASADSGELAVGGASGSVVLSQEPDLQQAADQYRSFLAARADALVADLTSLAAAVGAGDVAGARTAYLHTRADLGAVEPAADNFGDAEPAGQDDLAEELDGPSDAGPTDPVVGLRLVEQGLWGTGPVVDVTQAVARALATARQLQVRIGAMHLDAVEAAGGSGDELAEAIARAAGAAPARPPGLAVADLQAAAEAAAGLLGALHPALVSRDPGLDAVLAERLARLDAAIAAAGTSGIGSVSGSASPTPTSSSAVVAAGDALADALAQMAPVLDRPER